MMHAATIITTLLTSLPLLQVFCVNNNNGSTTSAAVPPQLSAPSTSPSARNRNEDFQFPTERPQGHYITETPARIAGFSARNEPVFFEEDSPVKANNNYTPELNVGRINAPVVNSTPTTTKRTPAASELLIGNSLANRPTAADLNSGRFNGLGTFVPPNGSAQPKLATPPTHHKPIGNDLTDQLIDFSWTVFRLAKQPNRNGNLVLSPLLLQVTLALLQTASTGETHAQIDRMVRHLSPQQLHELSRSVVTVAAAHNGTQLGMAAAIFADRTFG